MNEVDICVTTKQSDVSSGLPLRGKWTQRVVIDIYGRNGEKRGSMQKEEEMDVEYMPDDDDILSEEEEEDSDIFELPQQPQPQGAACSISSNSTNPISIPSPLGQSPLSPGFSHVTPTHCSSSIMRRFSPVGSWEAISPMSSGYGSAPRFFSSIGTQTPPATPVFFETRIQLQFGENHSQDTADIGRLRLRQRLFHQENGRTRFYSEGSQREGASANDGARDLPDLVSNGNFRDRANSAPTRPSRSATLAGRELRRISDEFMLDFQQTRARRNSFLSRLFDMWSRRDQDPQRSQEAAEEEEDDDSRPNAVGAGI